MLLQDYTGEVNALLDTAFTYPKLKSGSADVETAMGVVHTTLAVAAKQGLGDAIESVLLSALEMYELENGEYDQTFAGSQERNDYESAVDGMVEDALEKWNSHLSADWIAKNTIETKLWLTTDSDRKAVRALADSAAKEVFKQFSADKTPMQVMASAGIVKEAVETRLAKHALQKEQKPEANSMDAGFKEAVAKIKRYLGKGFDRTSVYQDISMILEEDDDFLVKSALSRLGIQKLEKDFIKIVSVNFTLDGVKDVAAHILDLIDQHKEPSGRAKIKAKRAARAAEKAEAQLNGLDPNTFKILKDCGAKDTAMAEALGVSRSTYTNYMTGKTRLVPDEKQYALLRQEIVNRANALLAGLAALDGSNEVQQVA